MLCTNSICHLPMPSFIGNFWWRSLGHPLLRGSPFRYKHVCFENHHQMRSLLLSLSAQLQLLQAGPKPLSACLPRPAACWLGGFASVSRPVDSVDYSISLWSVKLRKQFQLSPKARCRPRHRPRPSTRPRQTRWQRVKKGNSKKNKNVYVCNNRGKKNKRNYDLSPPFALFAFFSHFWPGREIGAVKI